MAKTKEEMKQVNIYDYVVVNNDLDTTINEVRNIILGWVK